MKPFVLNIIFLLLWTYLGHFFPFVNLGFVFIFYPLMFILTFNLSKNYSLLYFIIPFCYVVILVNDYLFRIFGGGDHDDAGKGWCELIFYFTIITTTTAMLFFVFTMIKENKIRNSVKILSSFLYVIICCYISFLLFKKINVNI